MSRPRKQTVDYFPHNCKHGQTIFILEQQYKEIGYSFWFKLLEELGSKEGHFIDCRNVATQRFLQAKTFTDEQTCVDILDLLSEIEAIDPELWHQKIIWSKNFVDGIADVYKNRRVETPVKPSFYEDKPQSGEVSTGENPQSKVKESKVKESKGIVAPSATPDIEVIPDLFKDPKKHVQIIGLFAKAKEVKFKNKDHQQQFIVRNNKAASMIDSYDMNRIGEVMKYLVINADFKWTLETVGKYIDEDLSRLNKSDIVIGT